MTSEETPGETPEGTLGETPGETPAGRMFGEKSGRTLAKKSSGTPGRTLVETPGETLGGMLARTLGATLQHSDRNPPRSELHPRVDPAVTAEALPVTSSEICSRIRPEIRQRKQTHRLRATKNWG